STTGASWDRSGSGPMSSISFCLSSMAILRRAAIGLGHPGAVKRVLSGDRQLRRLSGAGRVIRPGDQFQRPTCVGERNRQLRSGGHRLMEKLELASIAV